MKKVVKSGGITLKKQYGQHFLKEISYIHTMLDAVDITDVSVFEIGPGQGALTQEILKKDVARLWAFEIDQEWVTYLEQHIKDARFTVHHTNILDVDFLQFKDYEPWVLLANLPYQITFPLLHLLQKYRHYLKEGVIMMQEEVAQKVVAFKGRNYGFSSLFFQHYFEWKLMDKVPPSAFLPPPKVFSRLLYFKPKEHVASIVCKYDFWKFIKVCFKQPRRILKNNLQQSSYDCARIPEKFMSLRAQQLVMDDFLFLWNVVRPVDCE